MSDAGPGAGHGDEDRAASSDRSSEPGRTRPGGRGSPGGRRPGEPGDGRRARRDPAAGSGTGSGAGSSAGATDGADPVPGPPRTPLTQQLGRVVLVLLAVLFGVFAVSNSQRVDFSWVFGETQVRTAVAGETTGGVPLIILLVVSLVVGIVVGMLVEWLILRRRQDPEER